VVVVCRRRLRRSCSRRDRRGMSQAGLDDGVGGADVHGRRVLVDGSRAAVRGRASDLPSAGRRGAFTASPFHLRPSLGGDSFVQPAGSGRLARAPPRLERTGGGGAASSGEGAGGAGGHEQTDMSPAAVSRRAAARAKAAAAKAAALAMDTAAAGGAGTKGGGKGARTPA
jgi:hypothetical protein